MAHSSSINYFCGNKFNAQISENIPIFHSNRIGICDSILIELEFKIQLRYALCWKNIQKNKLCLPVGGDVGSDRRWRSTDVGCGSVPMVVVEYRGKSMKHRWSTGQAMIDEAGMDRQWRGGALVEGSPPQIEQRRRKLASPKMEQHRRWKEAREWRWI
ncbi:unnamed protein product [Lactuca saligna]|uniref:Uncharacterized protein n=1 Tax=Lactuca saligna TaxID=75948 RepID=A0AA36DXG2_LACSI|nr:unnamed protein product [Lactuca saligna]